MKGKSDHRMQHSSGESAPRQTQTYLQELLDSNGLAPRRQLGQNFLIDLNLLNLLVESAGIAADDVVLEIGAGTGGLTARLAAVASRVVSVEVDPGFYKLARYELAGLKNVTLLHADALKSKNCMNPAVMQALADAMRECNRRDYALVANLPYDVATSVVGNLLLERTPVRSMTFTVQLEVAERIAAEPGTKDYGPISVLAQTVGRVTWIRRLGPRVFWPRPKVDSAILRIDVRTESICPTERLRLFHEFVRDLFSHRRKGTRQSLLSIPRFKAKKDSVDAILSDLGPDFVASRAEQLSVSQLLALFDALAKTTGTFESPS